MPNCQPSFEFEKPGHAKIGCGGCCGLFNIVCDPKERRELLTKRTQKLNRLLAEIAGVAPALQKRHFFEKAGILRQELEKKEAKSYQERHDKETYSCIFLGYLDDKRSQLGCMIHPTRTGIVGSQNASFYGASICLAYDCPNKEADYGKTISRLSYSFVQERKLSSFEYTLLMCDTMFWHYLKQMFHSIPGLENGLDEVLEFRMAPHKVRPELFRLTSFEVPNRNHQMAGEEARSGFIKYLTGADKNRELEVLLDKIAGK